MVEINYKERIINFNKKDTESISDIREALLFIVGTMAYPEDIEKARDYHLGSQMDLLRGGEATPEKCQMWVTGDPNISWHLINRYEEINGAYKSFWSRPKKGISRFSKATIVGRFAELLCMHHHNMTEVYGVVNQDKSLLQIKKNGENWIPDNSRKSYESIWNEFKHVAHLWWANNAIAILNNVSLFQDSFIYMGDIKTIRGWFNQFLGFANLFRGLLVNKRDPTAPKNHKKELKDYQIPNPDKVWKVLWENKLPENRTTIHSTYSLPLEAALTRARPCLNANGDSYPLIFITPSGEFQKDPKHENTEIKIVGNQVCCWTAIR